MSRSEAGTGLLGSAAGVLAVVTLLLFAVQLTLNLATASALDGAGYDAAREVASRTVDHDDPGAVATAMRRAEDHVRQAVGGTADVVELRWDERDGSVHLTIEVIADRVAPRSITEPVGLDRIRRTYVVQMERIR